MASDIYENYFKKLKDQVEMINIPKLNELAYEQVELAACRSPPSSRTRTGRGRRSPTRCCCAATSHLAQPHQRGIRPRQCARLGDGPDLWGCCPLEGLPKG